MANQHTTLAALFDDTADAIREVGGTSSSIVADTFPDKIRGITPCSLNDKFNMSITNVSTATINQVFTPKCFYHIGSYWFVGGENSSHDGYVAFSTNLTSWTIRLIGPGSERKLPVNALAYHPDTDTLWVFGDSNSYKSRSIISFTGFINNYAASSYSIKSSAGKNFANAVQNGNFAWALEGNKTTWIIDLSSGSYAGYTHSSISQAYSKACMYNSYPIAISENGYYTYKSSIDVPTVSGEYQIASSFTSYVCSQLGSYFAVAGTKSDGTYIYYAAGTPGSLIFKANKVLSKQVTPIGLACANGLYVMAYMDGTTLRFFATEKFGSINGISNLTATAINSNTGITMLANENVMVVLTESGGNPVIGKYTVP